MMEGEQMLDRLRRSVEGSRVMDIDGYRYFIHPVTDGIPRMDPELLEEIIGRIVEIGDFDCDLIITPESMGIHLAAPISLRLGIPYSIVRKRRYGLPGEIGLSQHTGYSKGDMFINGVRRGDRVVILDDVLSTGGTLNAIVGALHDVAGAEVKDVIVVFEKSQGAAVSVLDNGIRVKSLMKVDIIGGRTVCID